MIWKGNREEMSESNNSKYHIHISSKTNKFRLNLKEVWKYKDLIVLLTKRQFALTYKQTILGPIWILLTPLISSFIYAFVFGGIAGMGTDGVPHLLFYLTSNAIWTYFSSCVLSNANVFTANSNIFGKVYFPRLTVPVSNMLVSIIQFGIQMLLVLGFLLYYLTNGQVSPDWSLWWLIPFAVIHLGILGLGFGIVISSLTTKYRDLTILVNFGMQLWMYATPIVYPLSQLGMGNLRSIILLNPVTAPVELIRFAVLGVGTISLKALLTSWMITIIVAIFGILIFNKIERTFMDTV